MKKINVRNKLILIGICFLSLLLIFTLQVVKKYIGVHRPKLILREGEMITFHEVDTLLHYLGIEKESQEKEDQEGTLPKEDDYISFKDLSSLLARITTKLEIDGEKILTEISFDIEEEKENKAVLASEFLEVFEKLLEEIPSEKAPVKEMKLFIVGVPDQFAADKDYRIMATDQGKYKFNNGLDYVNLYENGSFIEEENQKQEKEEHKDQEADSKSHDFYIDTYVDHKVRAMVSGDELVYIKEILDEETILHNAWISHGQGQKVETFIHEVTKEFTTKSNLSQEINGLVGDLIIQNQEIVGIRIKPDRIDGKVLVTDAEYVEVEGYGKIPLDENYKIYKIYEEIAQELTNSILVGYESTDFIVAEGKIVAALIKEPIKAENIRVLIKSQQFESIYHKEVSLTSNTEFTVTTGEESLTYPAGTTVAYTADDDGLLEERVTIRPVEENGKITLLSFDRSYGNPSYRGSMEIAVGENGILIVNELPLEEYLYAVVPSEMPSSYGLEAVKSQAVCARSYAYNHLMANSLKEYGAHVDDSVSYQVYNNIEENEETILAVKDTYGKVMKHGGSVINAYYFSTSSGHTASVGEVWGGEAEYLKGKSQQLQTEEEVPVATDNNQVDFSKEETFREFILKPSYPTYDSDFPWYRWKTTLSFKNIADRVNSIIASRYQAKADYIQTLVKSESGEETYESIPIESIGTLKDINILKREKSGIVTQIKLVGSERTVKVIGEYNIRMMLAPGSQGLVRQDDSKQDNLSMLPSAFFIMDKEGESLGITGGGYGHGVGMSQNGAKTMADLGKGYEEILQHYYSGIELGYIYD